VEEASYSLAHIEQLSEEIPETSVASERAFRTDGNIVASIRNYMLYTR